MDRKVGQQAEENKSGDSRAAERTPKYIEPRRGWVIHLRDLHVDGRRQMLATARKGDRWLVLTPDPTAHGALERIRAACDDADTIESYRREREPDVTKVGGQHFLPRGGRR
jgi:hypothetical protein